MVDYSDYNPAGTTRTTKRGIARLIPLLPNYFNHQWFEDYVTDFLQTNILENNGVISGCVITQDGGNDAINTSGGEVYVNGNRVSVSASGPFSLTADGWYVSYVTSAGAIIHGYLENSTVQGAVTPADSVIIGYTLLGNSVLYINSFFNDVSDFESLSILATRLDQVIGTNAQVVAGDATVYYDSGSSSFKDVVGNPVVFSDGDRIKWVGLDTLTADIDLSAIDDLDWSMDTGLIIALGSYNLDLGENQRGELDLSGTGTLDILSSDGLRIKNSGLTIENNNGDIFIDNFRPSEKSANIEYKNLVAKQVTTDTVDENIDSLKLLDVNNNSLVVNDIDITYDIASDIHAGTEKASTWYQRWITAKQDGTIGKKLVPDLTGVSDGATSGTTLEDSTADWITDVVQVGDIVFNNTTKVKTKIDSITDLNTIIVEDSIFTSGDTYTIHILSPTLDAGHIYKANIGAVYNDSGSDFDDFSQIDNEVIIPEIVAFTGFTTQTRTSQDISVFIPFTAVGIGGRILSADGAGTSTGSLFLTPEDSDLGQKKCNIAAPNGALAVTTPFELIITTAQTCFAKVDAQTTDSNMYITSYKF